MDSYRFYLPNYHEEFIPVGEYFYPKSYLQYHKVRNYAYLELVLDRGNLSCEKILTTPQYILDDTIKIVNDTICPTLIQRIKKFFNKHK